MEMSATPAPEHSSETSSHTAEAAPELTLGSGAPAEEAPKAHTAPTIRGRIDRFGVAMGTGRRKTAVARVRIRRGTGKILVNNRPLDDYFRVERNRALIQRPLEATDMVGHVDIWVRAQGGGTTGQVGAVVLGIARALQAMEPSLHVRLSDGGFLTRDGRMVERKKYGKKKARRSFQFSKR
jgi:small subunit ribosomal protein S9